MALEAVKDIKNAESKAEEIIKKAQLESKSIIKNAEVKANEEYKRIISEANVSASSIISEAIKQGEKEAVIIKEKAQKDIDDIINLSEDKIKNAIKLVVERIVMNNGNS